MADEQPPNNLTDLNRDAGVPGLEVKSDETTFAEGIDAIDTLLLETQPESDEAKSLKEKREASMTDEQKAEAKTKEEAAAKEKADADAKAKAEADSKLSDEDKAKKAEADKVEADKKAKAEAAPKEEFEKIELPPHAKPATTESFAKVKMLAQQRIAKLSEEKVALDTQIKELNTKLEAAGKVAPEVTKELEELRNFRKSIDVEANPEFKEYDASVKSNDEFILKKLKEADVTDASIEKIKALGVANVDWEPILKELPPVARRFIETKLVQNEDLRNEKASAIAEAKKNAESYLKEAEEKSGKSVEARRTATDASVKQFATEKLPWFKKIEAPANVSAEDKKKIDLHNAFMVEAEAQAKDLIDDDTPEGRAIGIVGYLHMLRLQKEIPFLKSTHEAEKKALTEKVTALEKTVKEKEDFIAKVKKSSSTSLRSENGSDKSAASQFTTKTTAGEALDALRESATA